MAMTAIAAPMIMPFALTLVPEGSHRRAERCRRALRPFDKLTAQGERYRFWRD